MIYETEEELTFKCHAARAAVPPIMIEVPIPEPGPAACSSGGRRAWFASGELVQILPEWSNERYPLYAYHPSRHLPPAKVRAFLDFVQEIAGEAGAAARC
jgi:DNA-binding transcriptional LysR family regulator